MPSSTQTTMMIARPSATLLAAAAAFVVLALAASIEPVQAAAGNHRGYHSVATATAFDCPAACQCTNGTINLPHHAHPTENRYTIAQCTALTGLAAHRAPASIQVINATAAGLERIGNEFAHFTNLTVVVLANNRLAEVPHLSAATRLRGLQLAGNHIKAATLGRLPASLQYLNVSHNALRELHQRDFVRLPHLQTLALRGNPINCTCETLRTLAWLRREHVQLDEVRCAAPLSVKGSLWERAADRVQCQRGAGAAAAVVAGRGAGASALDSAELEDNELMMADQPVFENEDASVIEDEFERDFIPLQPRKKLLKRQLDDVATEDYDDFELDGDADASGDAAVEPEVVSEHVATVASVADEADQDDDGSGGDELPLINSRIEQETTTPAAVDTIGEHDDDDGSGDDGFAPFATGNDTETYDEATTTLLPTEAEEHIDPSFTPPNLNIFLPNEETTTSAPVAVDTEASAPIGRMAQPSDAHPHKVTAAEKETAESTYIVLVMLAILLLGLIAFVAIRRKNAARRARDARGYGGNDAENGHSKELVDMNRTHPGKPANGNGNGAEVLPLIGARDKWDSRIQPGNGLTKPDQEELRRAQEPLLQRLEADPPQQAADETPEVHAQKRPESQASQSSATVPASAPAGAEANNNQAADQNDHPTVETSAADPAYQPISPKPARYSPVYSPETGRVKIKLAEMPRPRTPMLVQRSRSNAGEMVSTPLRPPK